MAGAFLCAAVGLLFYLATAMSIDSDARARFDSVARNAQYMLNLRIKSYADVLRSSASMFQSQGGMSRVEFHQYVEGLDLPHTFPDIETINYAERVSDPALPGFVTALAALPQPDPSGYPPFGLKSGKLKAGDHEVVVYIEPIAVWQGKLGLDLFSENPVVVKAMTTLRDTGRISTSGQPLPVLTGPNRIGFAMRLPIYRQGMPHATVAERRAAYLGSVGLGFSVPRLVDDVIRQMSVHEVRLTLTDQAKGTLLYDSAATRALPHPAAARADGDTLVSTLPIDFFGRTWMATFSTSRAAAYSVFDSWFPWLASLAGALLTMLLYALFHTLASSRQRAIRLAREMTRELRNHQVELQLSHENLRRLAAHADQIKEQERRRIAREIHDDLGQNLLAVRIDADLLSARTAQRHPHLHARACATVQQIDSTIRSVRQIINDLRPNVLDLGLNAAVDWLIADFRRRTGVHCELIESDKDIRVNEHCATAFFRILQESLSNVSRHAHASAVRVELRFEYGVLSMSVSDNGAGMAPDARAKAGSFGLVGIEERIKILGGQLRIDSRPGAGTTVQVRVDVEAEAQPVPEHAQAEPAASLL